MKNVSKKSLEKIIKKENLRIGVALIKPRRAAIKKPRNFVSTYMQKAGALDQVLTSCTSLDARYQPNKEALMPTALSLLLEQAHESLKAVTVARTNYRLAVNNRSQAFAGVPKLAARVVRIVKVSEASAEHIADANAIKNLFYPPKKKRSSSAPEGQQENVTPTSKRSANSRQGFQGKMETFGDLIQIVEAMGTYNPQEADLTIEALKTKLSDLNVKSKAVTQAYVDYSNSRIARDEAFNGLGGVHETTKAVKDYIRGAFGIFSRQSDQMQQLSR